MATHKFQDLQVWQRSMLITEDVYRITKSLPSDERFALANQLRRCAVSVPSNIAEGQKRLNRQETIQFCGIALGSLAELQTQLILVKKLYQIDTDTLVDECEQVSKMITALIKSLRSKN